MSNELKYTDKAPIRLNYRLYKLRKEIVRVSTEASEKFDTFEEAEKWMVEQAKLFIRPACEFLGSYYAHEFREAGFHVPGDFAEHDLVRLVHASPAARYGNTRYGFRLGFRAEMSKYEVTHNERVAKYRDAWGQIINTAPQIPDENACELLLRLLFEENFELAEAVGFYLQHDSKRISWDDISFVRDPELVPNLKDAADATSDLQVVLTGANQMLGIPPDDFVWVVDVNNMAKAGGHRDPDTGKWIKPAGHTPPDLGELLAWVSGD